MRHLKLLFFFLIIGIQSSLAQTFTNPLTVGTPNPSALNCNGIYGLRMDDGLGGNGEEATAVWCNSNTIDLNQSFDIEFDIRFGNVGQADGMTFTLQRQGLNAIAGGGGYLGVTNNWNGGGGITPSVNVEFDIFNNGVTPNLDSCNGWKYHYYIK